MINLLCVVVCCMTFNSLPNNDDHVINYAMKQSNAKFMSGITHEYLKRYHPSAVRMCIHGGMPLKTNANA